MVSSSAAGWGEANHDAVRARGGCHGSSSHRSRRWVLLCAPAAVGGPPDLPIQTDGLPSHVRTIFALRAIRPMRVQARAWSPKASVVFRIRAGYNGWNTRAAGGAGGCAGQKHCLGRKHADRLTGYCSQLGTGLWASLRLERSASGSGQGKPHFPFAEVKGSNMRCAAIHPAPTASKGWHSCQLSA